MTVYLGKNPVGVGRIVEKKVAKKKFGATVDTFLGDVDADGNYVAPSETFEVNLAGVKSVDIYNNFPYKFYKSKIKKLIANDLVDIGGSSSFAALCASSPTLEEAHFDGVEEISSGGHAFFQAFKSCFNLKNITFAKLKKVSSIYVFNEVFASIGPEDVLSIENVFPVLEEISGSGAFEGFITHSYYVTSGTPVIFPAVKKITGASSQYSGATFGSFYTKLPVWHFPSATEFTGYIWNAGASYTGEIHFAAANRAAIEACDGYANKWGFAGATIYFDL